MGKERMISYHYVVNTVFHFIKHERVIAVLAIDVCAKEALLAANIAAIEGPTSL